MTSAYGSHESEADKQKIGETIDPEYARGSGLVYPTVPQGSHTPHKKPFSFARTEIFIGALLIVLSVGAGFLGGWVAGSHGNQTTIHKEPVVLESHGQLISGIANLVGQSVASINTTQATTPSSLNNLFGLNVQPQQEQSAGTGIILTSSGLIITNRHVVPAGTTNVSVTLSNGTTYNNVKVVGRTNQNDSLDVAFLQIQDTKGQTLVPAQLGDSSKMQVGSPVIAIGNALGQYQNTVTTGIISGYGRSVQASDSTGAATENLNDMFQTDAAINEGNSGGPLVNMDGQVIGINTALASSAQNIGFAIPINDVAGLIKSVEQTSKLQQPYLGVIYIPVTSDVVKQYSLSVSSGAYIPPASVVGQQPVVNGGPAARAGVKAGDIITKVNSIVINQQHSLTSVLDQQTVGSQVTLTIVRNSKNIEITVTLGSAPTG
ncbi:MAG TPA: trypsin-like peptidase domain-containing protein [Candidatus Saccharimonadales bacterium]|nr:trypsin-like peptidase domain-containing protein [Candidatus Saccharimonadales bacterium]